MALMEYCLLELMETSDFDDIILRVAPCCVVFDGVKMTDLRGVG